MEGRRPSVHRPAERMTLVKLASVGMALGRTAVDMAVDMVVGIVAGMMVATV